MRQSPENNKITIGNLEKDIIGDSEDVKITTEQLQQEINEDLQKIETYSGQITNISDQQEKQIVDLGGDVNEVKLKIKTILNPLKTIRDKMERNFLKIIGVLGVVAGTTAAIDQVAEYKIEKRDLEYRKQRKENSEKWEMKENNEKLFNFLKHIKSDSTESLKVINNLHSLFNKEEILYNISGLLQIDDTTQSFSKFEFLFDDDLMGKLVKLDQVFDISPEFLFQDFIYNSELKSLIKSSEFDTDIFPQILRIRELIPETTKNPSIGFVDIGNKFKNVNNPTYYKALEFISTTNFNSSGGVDFSLSENIIDIYSDKKLRHFVNYLTSKDVFFDQTISWCSANPNFDAVLKPKEYEKFFELFNEKYPLTNAELGIITTSNRYTDDMKITIKNGDFLKRLEKVKDQDLDFRPLLHLKPEMIQNVINNKNFLEAYILLARNFTINRDGYDNVDNILSWYTSGDDIDPRRIEADFLWRKEKTGISNINYFYEVLMNENIDDFKHIVLSPALAQERHFDEFFRDPAFRFIIERLNVLKITPEYLKNFSSKDQKEWILRIARNMYISKTEPTEKNFEDIFKKTISLRENKELIETSLFKDRNIALFAHNEKIPEMDNIERFGNSFMVSALKKQLPESLKIFKAVENTDQDLVSQKNKFIDYISNNDKLTVIINAHGSSDGVFFTDGVPNNNGVIEKQNDHDFVSVAELAVALEQRFDNGHIDTPIFILSSCYNQDFIRSLYESIMNINNIKKKSISIPIMCGSTEYGQYSFSDYDSKYKDRFLEAILNNTIDTKIKDLIEIEDRSQEKGILTNPSLFIPVQENNINPKSKDSKKQTFFQIAEVLDKTKKQVSHMENFAQSAQEDFFDKKTVSYFEEIQPGAAKNIREIIKKQKSDNSQNIT